jgi:hypothetical protein
MLREPHVCVAPQSKGTSPKGERQQEYGILMHNMEELSEFGTCLMTDGRYLTIASYDLFMAFKRIKEDTYKISPVNESKCQALYVAAAGDTTAMKIRIEKSQLEYSAALKQVQEARAARRKELARIAKATKKKKAPPVQQNRVVTPRLAGTAASVVLPGTQDESVNGEHVIGTDDQQQNTDPAVEDRKREQKLTTSRQMSKLQHSRLPNNKVVNLLERKITGRKQYTQKQRTNMRIKCH